MRMTRYTHPGRSLAYPRNPWTGLENEINQLFQTAVSDFTNLSSGRQFPVDVYEDKDHVYVRAELPGVNRDDINVEMAEGYLAITAARKTTAGDGKGEESFSFSRVISVPDSVNSDKVAAHYENGVLTVTLPKREEAKPKKVAIAVK